MTDFSRTNRGDVVGGPGEDRLIVTYDYNSGGMYLTDLQQDPNGGYFGTFDGFEYWGETPNDVLFQGIEHFTFTDLTGLTDVIHTGDGDDTLNSGAGYDQLYSGGGIDVIDGGAGNDFWSADKSFATTDININLNDAVSTYLGSGSVRNIEAMELTTGSGNDLITGHDSVMMADWINTGAGDDVITLWIGNTDRVYGGSGDDRLVINYNLSGGGVRMIDFTGAADGSSGGTIAGFTYGGEASNEISFLGIEHFTFNDLLGLGDEITTGDGNDIINAGGGNDTISTGAGIDVVDGGDGDDFWRADRTAATTNIRINLNNDTSTISSGGSIHSIEAIDIQTGIGNDRITGYKTVQLYDSVMTGAGDDVISLWAGGHDYVDGGEGTDRLIYTHTDNYSSAPEVGFTDNGVDGYSGRFDGYGTSLTFVGIEHFTFVDLSGTSNTITTGRGDDVFKGGGGNDVFNSGTGIDKVYGGTGNDTWIADKSFATEAMTINLNKASTYLASGEVKSIEGLELRTGAGNDKITSHRTAGMDDSIHGGKGADLITMWTGGTDSVDGGRGVDRLKFIHTDNYSSAPLVDLRESGVGHYSGVFQGYGTTLSFKGIEHFTFVDLSGTSNTITTGRGRDILKGGGGNDVLSGSRGFDRLYGQNGNDTLNGGFDVDRLFGGAGDDVLFGGIGKDFLHGGLDDDMLTGGGRADVFWFNGNVDEGTDHITDFRNGVDIIRIKGESYADLDVQAVNGGADTQVTLASGTEIILDGVSSATIQVDDFSFV